MSKKIIMLFMLLAITTSFGCEDDLEIYTDHTVSACNIKDPLNNLSWMKDIQHSKQTASISLYQHKNTHDHYFLVGSFARKDIDDMPTRTLYNCSGEQILSFGGGEDPKIREEFSNNYEELKMIFERK